MKNFKILDDLGYMVEVVGTMKDIYKDAYSVRNTYEHIEDYIEELKECLEYKTEYEVKAYNIYHEEDCIGTVNTIEEVEEELMKIHKDLIDVNSFFDKGYNFVMIRKNMEFYGSIDLENLEVDYQGYDGYFDESELGFDVYYNGELIEKDLDTDQLSEFILKTNYSQSDITGEESNKKYELTNETIEWRGRTLYRIKALRNFGDVKIGDLGGYVESEYNLSHEETCWVYDNAKVYDNAFVCGSATISEYAEVYNNADVGDEASVSGYAQVHDGATVLGKAKVFDEAEVYSNGMVCDNANIYGYAIVFGYATISDDAKVFGCALIYDGAEVFGYAQVYNNGTVFGKTKVYDDAKVYGNGMVYGNANIYGSAKVFEYAKVYGNGKVCGDAKVSGNTEVFDMRVNTGNLDQ